MSANFVYIGKYCTAEKQIAENVILYWLVSGFVAIGITLAVNLQNASS